MYPDMETWRSALHGNVIKLVTSLIFISSMTACDSREQTFNALRVAHAGGGINGETYTNSFDALDLNIKNGFRYFEIDFSFTSDDRLVCIHDWEDSFKRSFGFDAKERPSLKKFKALVREHAEFRKCTLEGLADWMRKNPEAVLITDVKEQNLKALAIIFNKIPDAMNRVIPQIYRPENYKTARDLGFKSIIWTLYRYRIDSKVVLEWADWLKGPFAITMPVRLATTKLPAQLASRNIPTYVHTINNKEEMARLINRYNVTEIYTDFISPIDTE